MGLWGIRRSGVVRVGGRVASEGLRADAFGLSAGISSIIVVENKRERGFDPELGI